MYYVHHVCAGPTEARRTHWNWVVVFHYLSTGNSTWVLSKSSQGSYGLAISPAFKGQYYWF